MNQPLHYSNRADIDAVPDGVRRPLWSVMIPTYNCADYLKETLASVLTQDPCTGLMQIEVVDDCSTEDDSATVVEDVGHGRVTFDPDERITPGLAEALRQLAWRDDLDAIVIPRMNYDLGYASSSPVQRYETQLPMYRRSKVEWPTVPNALPEVPGQRKYRVPQRDNFVIIHERNRNIPEAVERIIRYAPAQAQSMIDQGEVFTAKRMLSALARQVDKEFFWARAWEDGMPGIFRASILVAYKFYMWAAFWQLSGAQRRPEDERIVRRIGLVLRALRWSASLAGRCYRLIRRVLGRLPY